MKAIYLGSEPMDIPVKEDVFVIPTEGVPIFQKWLETHDKHVKKEVIKEIFSKIGQPNECLFDYRNACCYPIDDCINCPITIGEMKEVSK